MTNRSFRGVRIIRFGVFELDVRAAELRNAGQRIRIQEQPYRLLTMLLEHPGEVVLREEIRRRLWPNDTVVEVSHGINAAVLRLREALGESAENPVYIETVARRGYRFRGEAEITYRDRADAVRAPAEPRAPETLEPPSKVSHYRVLDQLGAGGMGVVYRAEDLKLGRQVALKFLPPEIAADPSAIGRFHREARAASALNHPNICTIFGVEDYAGQPVIVMELVEGRTLEAVLSGGALPREQALAIAIQIVAALEAAHRKGVVHRDLKPGNVLVNKSTVKVLDFGLAKIERPGGTAAAHVTQEGAILGTLHYMSPEQVQGQEANAASDIFSFGLVLYEMLAGRQAFDGPSAAAVMAAILSSEAPRLPDGVSSLDLNRVLDRCLAKDPEDRWQSASDLKAAIQWIVNGPQPGPASAGTRSAPQRPRLSSIRIPSAISPANWRRTGAFAAAAAILLLAMRLFPDTATWRGIRPASSPTITPSFPLGATPGAATLFSVESPAKGAVQRISISPDGRRVAFVAEGHLFTRRLDALDSQPLPDTTGAGTPFWSPDGLSVAYGTGSKLKVVTLSNGIPVDICAVNTNIAGDWGADGTILIGRIGDGIFRVPVAGGNPVRVTQVDPSRQETRHLAPQFLPGGRNFLYVAGSNVPHASVLYAGALDSNDRKALMQTDSRVAFVPAQRRGDKEYLVFVRAGTLLARAFDSSRLTVGTSEFVLATGLASRPVAGAIVDVPDFSVSPTTLIYCPSTARRAAMPEMLPVAAPSEGGSITVVQNWMAMLK